MDIRIPGVSVNTLYAFAETLDAGGTGLGIYPTGQFIHFDFRAPGERASRVRLLRAFRPRRSRQPYATRAQAELVALESADRQIFRASVRGGSRRSLSNIRRSAEARDAPLLRARKAREDLPSADSSATSSALRGGLRTACRLLLARMPGVSTQRKLGSPGARSRSDELPGRVDAEAGCRLHRVFRQTRRGVLTETPGIRMSIAEAR